jgi:zinc/manganese transport system permease protein
VSHFLSPVFAPGFFQSSVIHIAVVVGALAAVVSAVVGVFTVLRGQSFAGHAFGDIEATGGAGAYLVGIGPLLGFLIAAVIGAVAMEAIGIQRVRGRDLATGIVLGATLGLAALFLYLETTSSTTGVTVSVLFGSLFGVTSSTIPLVILLSAIAVAIIAVLFRPLLLSSISPELAAARGIPVRLVGALYLLSLAAAAALAALTIGAILSTALLIGPAATALRLTRSPGRAMLTAGLLGVGATWIGIVLAYDSFRWPPVNQGWPLSFFIVTLVLVFYLLAGLPAAVRARVTRTDRPARASGAELAA